MAQRSVIIVIDNQTSQDLVLSTFNIPHGVPLSSPPQNIPPHTSSPPWEVDSDGFATGVEGNVIYHFQSNSSQLVTLYFDDPFEGDNVFSGQAPSPEYSVTPTVTGGNNASVIYTVTGP
jgi:hypothetical protein